MADKKVITWMELKSHSSKESCWTVIENNVYDVTQYLGEHPGGEDILIKFGGKDSTFEFNDANHTAFALSVKDTQLIGTIEKNKQPEEYVKWYINSVKVDGKIVWDEIKKHDKEGDCWCVISGKVYDLSNYLNNHPGGPAVLLGRGGKDATKAFEAAKHPESAIAERKTYEIGDADGNDPRDRRIQDNSVFNLTNLICAIILAALGYYFLIANE